MASIIITGKQGSGKTRLMEKLLSKVKRPKLLSYKKFAETPKSDLQSRYDSIGIDGVYSPNAFDYLSRVIKAHEINLVVTTQNSPEDLKVLDLSGFEIINL